MSLGLLASCGEREVSLEEARAVMDREIATAGEEAVEVRAKVEELEAVRAEITEMQKRIDQVEAEKEEAEAAVAQSEKTVEAVERMLARVAEDGARLGLNTDECVDLPGMMQAHARIVREARALKEENEQLKRRIKELEGR